MSSYTQNSYCPPIYVRYYYIAPSGIGFKVYNDLHNWSSNVAIGLKQSNFFYSNDL